MQYNDDNVKYAQGSNPVQRGQVQPHGQYKYGGKYNGVKSILCVASSCNVWSACYPSSVAR